MTKLIDNSLNRYHDLLDHANSAINYVKKIIKFLELGPPLIHRDPEGCIRLDIPIMLNGFAVDRVHLDPINGIFLPKGLHRHKCSKGIGITDITGRTKKMLEELRVIDAVEYRDPENSWVVYLAWKEFIVMHIKVDFEGKHIVPDKPLTEEVSRHFG